MVGLPAQISAADIPRPATIGFGLTLNVDVMPDTGELHVVALFDIELIVIVVEPAVVSEVVAKVAAPPLVVIVALPVPAFAPVSV